ncbi:MAG: TIGR01777 family oxidoreductase [Demequinaceae bacterium]|nr:TIGR01777 family oxidoreductase [Demequinaceae bacterium]
MAAGCSGLVGTALVHSLEQEGHEVVRLVRRQAQSRSESTWNPPNGTVDRDLVKSADLVINLAGASIGDHRLTRAYAQTVLDSRVTTTRLLSRILAEQGGGRLIQASAMGYYGIRGDELLPERSEPGASLLASITIQWEDATAAAVSAGVRVQWLRTGLVLSPNGGIVDRLLPLIRLRLLRSLGPGDNFLSWITLPDAVRAILFLISSGHFGPVNLVTPDPTPSRDLISALSEAASRRGVLPVPGAFLRLAIGPAVDDLLGSQRGVPGVLNRLGFEWDHPDIASAAAWIITEDRKRKSSRKA